MDHYDFDIVVIGGGHAGIEAASAPARLALNVALVTMDHGKTGLMSCNPAIGGLAKGQLVREIDALGGIMAKIIDRAGIHFKMLNKSKGPAVWSPRAQADRKYYAQVAQEILAKNKNITVIEATASALIINKNCLKAVVLENGQTLQARAAIVTAGTFLNGIIHIGLNNFAAGRAGEKSTTGLTECLLELGFETGRLKTGTPPRLHRDSINFEPFEVQYPDNPPSPFSYWTPEINRNQINCYIGYTNPVTHKILEKGFSESPMFTGRIKSVGPRYCPSIEDKVNRFSERNRHQLFLEPEGYNDPEIYLNGFSTSLPEKIQVEAVHAIKGLEKAEILRLGYAVEYDFFPPHQLKYTLETKKVNNLYFAGQVNGTSGYEEAAAQGLMAGINAALKLKGEAPLQLARSEAYIGVMVDDLINKSTLEPYRMFTSRAEFRLQLRQDNADLRLAHYGYKLGMLAPEEYHQIEHKQAEVLELGKLVQKTKISPDEFFACCGKYSKPLKNSLRVSELVKRPEVKLETLIKSKYDNKYSSAAVQEVQFNIKYNGYIKRNQAMIERFQHYEKKSIPVSFNYQAIKALSVEAIEKLEKIRPASFGQASRISGVTPADLSVLLIHLERFRNEVNVSRET